LCILRYNLNLIVFLLPESYQYKYASGWKGVLI
jgi:hypothetical protein